MDLCGAPYIMGHSMEAHGPPWRMEVRGGSMELRGGPWSSVEVSMECPIK